MHRPSNKAENHYKRRTAMNIYARQGSLRPHSSQNRTRSKSNSRTPEQGRKIRKHSQRSLTVPIRKTRRRPRNLHKRKNGQRIRNRSIRPAKRTNLSNSKNKIWVPHNKKTRINVSETCQRTRPNAANSRKPKYSLGASSPNKVTFTTLRHVNAKYAKQSLIETLNRSCLE